MALTTNEEIFDAFIRHQISLLRLSGSITKDVLKILDSTEVQMRDRLLSSISVILSKGSFTANKKSEDQLLALAAALLTIRQKSFKIFLKLLTKEMGDLAVMEGQVFAMNNIVKSLPVEFKTKLPTKESLLAVIQFNAFQGRTAKEWVENLLANDVNRIMRIIKRELTNGVTNSSAIARLIVGTLSQRGVNGATAITRRHATNIVRTVMNGVAHDSRTLFYKANPNLIVQELYVATLDGRTTLVCMNFDGQTFLVGIGPMPPIHFNCRSIRIPFIDHLNLVNRPFVAATRSDLVGLSMRQKRAKLRALTGTVPGNISYNAFLKRQSVQFQNDVLGKQRGILFRKGELSVNQFTDRKGAELTLAELRVNHPGSFEQAGL